MSNGWYHRRNKALDVTCPQKGCHAKRGIPCYVPSGVGTHTARVDKANKSRERRVDLFKDCYASRLLRFALQHGTTTLVALKNEQHRLGGAQGNIMHTLDCYFRQPKSMLRRGDKRGRTYDVHWVGSGGGSWEHRALSWLSQLTDAQLDDAFARCERDMLAATSSVDVERANEWLRIVQHAISCRATRVDKKFNTNINNAIREAA